MTPKDIVLKLEASIGLAGPPRPLVAAIDESLRHHFGLLPIRAAEEAERVANVVAGVISAKSIEAEKSGTLTTLVLLGARFDAVAGCCHVLPLDSPEIATAKQHRLHVGSLLAAIHSVSFAEFERFGARVLAEIGSTQTHITPHREDQGIDFFGTLSLGGLQPMPEPFAKLAHDIVVSFAGQAKHHPNDALGPDVVRELIGAVSLARMKVFSRAGIDLFPGFDLKPFSPMVTLLFTTGRITRGASDLARSAGIIARTGEQLAVFLADRGVGMSTAGTDASFDAALFNSWLNG